MNLIKPLLSLTVKTIWRIDYEQEEQAYDYSKRVSRDNLMTKDLAECSFMVGWDACLKHLGEIPWDEAMNEIANHLETNRSEKLNDYQNE